MPEVEIDRPQRQRDQRMGEHTQPFDHAQRKDRPQDLSRHPDDEAERREIAEQHVLHHVHEEEVLLAERVDRRVEREHDERDPVQKLVRRQPGTGRPSRASVRVRRR